MIFAHNTESPTLKFIWVWPRPDHKFAKFRNRLCECAMTHDTASWVMPTYKHTVLHPLFRKITCNVNYIKACIEPCPLTKKHHPCSIACKACVRVTMGFTPTLTKHLLHSIKFIYQSINTTSSVVNMRIIHSYILAISTVKKKLLLCALVQDWKSAGQQSWPTVGTTH